MTTTIAPVPANEMSRVIELSEYNLDYSSLDEHFKNLTQLAASVTRSHASVVNIIDFYTQWTVSCNQEPFDPVPREESVCQWTLNESEKFEVKDLSADERFVNIKPSINDIPLTYYYGIPLKSPQGNNLGALCILNDAVVTLSPEKEELLKIIGNEIINRLESIKAMESLKHRIEEANESKKRVAHDIRGPLAGIIGLAKVISDQGNTNQLDEVLEFISLIHKSGTSLLDLASEILSNDTPATGTAKPGVSEFNQVMLKDKLEKLYVLQASNKNVNLHVTTDAATAGVPFSKNKLLQIIGNLVSNAIKFTPANGLVQVNLSLLKGNTENMLKIIVSDTGLGMDSSFMSKLLSGDVTSTNGTNGENGYGFGLALVKHLITELKGQLLISSEPGSGTRFEVHLPQNK